MRETRYELQEQRSQAKTWHTEAKKEKLQHRREGANNSGHQQVSAFAPNEAYAQGQVNRDSTQQHNLTGN